MSGDVWNTLLGKAERENEAYDKIKMGHIGERITSYGILFR